MAMTVRDLIEILLRHPLDNPVLALRCRGNWRVEGWLVGHGEIRLSHGRNGTYVEYWEDDDGE
jgi:hypothetical protein